MASLRAVSYVETLAISKPLSMFPFPAGTAAVRSNLGRFVLMASCSYASRSSWKPKKYVYCKSPQETKRTGSSFKACIRNVYGNISLMDAWGVVGLSYLAECCESLFIFWRAPTWARVLPVQVQTIKAMSSQEADWRLNECSSVSYSWYHNGEPVEFKLTSTGWGLGLMNTLQRGV